MSLIDIPLHSLTKEHIDSLISNTIAEGRQIDYKRDYNLNLDDYKKEERKKDFLADVISFATSSGGDIIYGIFEEAGIPKTVHPITSVDFDKEKLKLTQVIRSGIEPKINFDFIEIPYGDGHVFVVRIFKSFSGPAMINNGSNPKFYSRTSNGKFPLAYQEIKDAYLNSATYKEQFINFRSQRLDYVLSGELGNHTTKPFSLYHFNPITQQNINLKSIPQMKLNELMAPYNSYYHFNLEGYITFSATDEFDFTQLFTNGTVEYYTERLLHENGFMLSYFESILLERTTRYFELCKMLDVQPPFIASLVLYNFKKLPVKAIDIFDYRDYYPPKTNSLLLPEVMIYSYDESLEQSLKPIFDAMWRSYGISGSLNYTDVGERKKRTR